MASSTSSALQLYSRRWICLSSQSRAFSSSCRRARCGSLVAFPPTSSPDLDAFLSNIRETIFLPNHLVKMHRDLIYRESLHHFVTGEEPVIVPVKTIDALDYSKAGTESVKLTPMKLQEEKSSQRIFKELLPLLQSKEDWSIVPAFLREFRATKRVLRQEYISKLIRTAAATRQYGSLIEMVKNCEETGLVLDSTETAMELMLLCLSRAYATEWSEKDVEKAAKHANAAIWMMKQPRHAPNGVEASQASRPEIIGVALALAGIKSLKLKELQDEDGKVMEYAQEFIKSWPKANKSLDSKTPDEANKLLQQWVPAWLGVQLAFKILKDTETLQQLNNIFDTKLSSMVIQAVTMIQDDPKANGGREKRGMEIYDTLSKVL